MDVLRKKARFFWTPNGGGVITFDPRVRARANTIVHFKLIKATNKYLSFKANSFLYKLGNL